MKYLSMNKKAHVAGTFLVLATSIILLPSIVSAANLQQTFPSWMPEPIISNDFHDASHPVAVAPPFSDGSNLPATDKVTNKKVWRLGGSHMEMDKKVLYRSPNEFWTQKSKRKVVDRQSQHFYSRTPVANSDQTYAIGSAAMGRPFSALWSLRTKELVAWVPASKATTLAQIQILWDKNLNNVYWFLQDNKLYKATIDFSTYKVTVDSSLRTFIDYTDVTFGRGDGNFDDTGNKIVITGFKNGVQYIIPFMVKEDRVLKARPVPEGFDSASIDPQGKFIIYDVDNGKKDNNGNNIEQTLKIPFDHAATAVPEVLYGRVKHGDFVVDSNNVSWYVYGDYRGVFAVRLSDSFEKRIWPTYVENPSTKVLTIEKSATGHISRVSKRPGMILVSRLDDGMYFMNIDEPGYSSYVANAYLGKRPTKIFSDAMIKQFGPRKLYQPWGITKEGEVTNYLREPRANSSATGRYVFFVSDYRSLGDKENAYNLTADGKDPGIKNAHLNLVDVNSSATNVEPIARDDHAVSRGSIIDINVLGNDSDADADTLYVYLGTQAQNGIVKITNNRTTYTPNQGFIGTDTFTYILSDKAGHTAVATVTVTVTAPTVDNVAPIAQDDQVTSNGSAITIDVLSNDSDADGDSLAIYIGSQPQNGIATIQNSRAIYTPTQGFSGTDTFKYNLSDKRGHYAVGTVTVTINSPTASGNVAPIAQDDQEISNGSAITIDVLSNDSDADGDSLAIYIGSQPQNGIAAIQNSRAVYTPTQGFSGMDTFKYNLSDKRGHYVVGTVTVTVNSPTASGNVAPIAQDDQEISNGSAITIDVLSNDSDADGDSLAIYIGSQPQNGIATIQNNRAVYTPTQGFSGTDTFRYNLSDKRGHFVVGTVTVTVN